MPNTVTVTHTTDNTADVLDTTIASSTAADAAVAAVLDQPLQAQDYISALKEARNDWQRECHRATHASLYNLLAKILRVYELMSQDNDEGARLRKQLDETYDPSKKHNRDTHTITKLCKIVFHDDRRSASAYSIVLRTAIDARKSSADVAAWISAQGGVEVIRKANNNSAVTIPETNQSRAKRAYAQLNNKQLAIVNSTDLALQTDTASVGQHVVLLATQGANGSFKVHAVVSKTSVVEAAFAQLADAKETPASNDNTAALRDAIVSAATNN